MYFFLLFFYNPNRSLNNDIHQRQINLTSDGYLMGGGGGGSIQPFFCEANKTGEFLGNGIFFAW